jgi:hypothetical protein
VLDVPPLAVSDLALALITAGSAIVGAVAGGGITGYITPRAEEKRQDFARQEATTRAAEERERERRAEQASGRLVLDELLRCGAAMDAAAGSVPGGNPDAGSSSRSTRGGRSRSTWRRCCRSSCGGAT